VTEIPGTTRDIIQENLNIGGVLFTITDTAGLRTTNDIIEYAGITKAMKEISNSDLILFVVDLSETIDDDDKKIFDEIIHSNRTAHLVVVGNKLDIEKVSNQNDLNSLTRGASFIKCSAKTGQGIDLLKNEMLAATTGNDISAAEKSVSITDIRHKTSLEKAVGNLVRSKEDISAGKSNEFASIGLRSAIDDLGEIIGAVTTDDLLDSIFSKFCIGK
jgi:tRNA modification GTPase